MTDSNNTKPGQEGSAERALRDGLRAPALSPEAMQRIRAATHAEWRAQHETLVPARARSRRLPLAAAAAVLMLAAAVGWNLLTADSGANGVILGALVRFDSPGVVESRRLRSDIVLTSGAELHAGQTLEVRGDALFTLVGGGNLRVARGSTIEVLAASAAVRLERGELYVDMPAGSRNDGFTVVTPAGEFRHVGTQFAVANLNGVTRLRVREGSVRWHASDGDSTVDAGTEVTIDHSRTVTRRPIASAGREWAWAESMAPDIEIEDRPLQEFLVWFARETGRKLVLADEAVRAQTTTIRMHGNVHGLTAMEALSAVMAATTLRFELSEGVIRVSSARDPKTSPS